MSPSLVVHVDLDSPRQLLKFWGRSSDELTGQQLDKYFDIALGRLLSFCQSLNVPITLFCIGEDLEKSISAQQRIKQSVSQGHEVANHTHSHLYGFARLPKEKIHQEIKAAEDIILKHTGILTKGFRAPGFSISQNVIDVLQERSYLYDSSAFWTSLHPLIYFYHQLKTGFSGKIDMGDTDISVPRDAYFIGDEDWKKPNIMGEKEKLVELPVATTNALRLPFYSNFHHAIGTFPSCFSARSINSDCLVYLLHLVEFVDFNDGLPEGLKKHSGFMKPVKQKQDTIEMVLKNLMKTYQVQKTEDFCQKFSQKMKS